MRSASAAHLLSSVCCLLLLTWLPPPAEGRLQLNAVETEPGCTADEVLSLAAAAERNTRHPLADALIAAAESRGALPTPTDWLLCTTAATSP